ncbi:MAG TPA: hypothetical protein VIM24_13080, partial [Candidatus Limnocylindrales bacterium]
YNQGPGQHDLLYVLDVNGRTLAISPPSIRPTRPLTGPSSRRSSTRSRSRLDPVDSGRGEWDDRSPLAAFAAFDA